MSSGGANHAKSQSVAPGERILAGVVAALSAGVLGVAAWLNPSPAGHGTHEQLALPACDWAVGFSMPCPTCGMTTSFAWAASGDLMQATLTQPFGALLALGTAGAFWIGLHIALTGSHAFQIVARTLLRPAVVWPAGVAFLASWGYKILTWTG